MTALPAARELFEAAVNADWPLDPPRAEQDRRLRGVVDQDDVRLWVRSGRKSWNIEFRGTLRPSGEGAKLDGVIDMPDRSALRSMMRLMRIASCVPLGFVLGSALVNGLHALTLGGVVLGIGVAASAMLGTMWLERSGLRAAADDANTLETFLKSKLGDD